MRCREEHAVEVAPGGLVERHVPGLDLLHQCRHAPAVVLDHAHEVPELRVSGILCELLQVLEAAEAAQVGITDQSAAAGPQVVGVEQLLHPVALGPAHEVVAPIVRQERDGFLENDRVRPGQHREGALRVHRQARSRPAGPDEVQRVVELEVVQQCVRHLRETFPKAEAARELQPLIRLVNPQGIGRPAEGEDLLRRVPHEHQPAALAPDDVVGAQVEVLGLVHGHQILASQRRLVHLEELQVPVMGQAKLATIGPAHPSPGRPGNLDNGSRISQALGDVGRHVRGIDLRVQRAAPVLDGLQGSGGHQRPASERPRHRRRVGLAHPLRRLAAEELDRLAPGDGVGGAARDVRRHARRGFQLDRLVEGEIEDAAARTRAGVKAERRRLCRSRPRLHDQRPSIAVDDALLFLGRLHRRFRRSLPGGSPVHEQRPHMALVDLRPGTERPRAHGDIGRIHPDAPP